MRQEMRAAFPGLKRLLVSLMSVQRGSNKAENSMHFGTREG